MSGRTLDSKVSSSIWRAGLPQLGALGALSFILGGYWDVAWHIDVGRDTFWTAPHLLLYAGITLVLGCLGLGLLQAWRLRDSALAPVGPGVSLPLGLRINPGLIVAGLGAVMSLTSAPIDDAWHRTFGLDVTIWSPPHLQLIFGVAIAALGLLAGLAAELNHVDPRRRDDLPPLDRDLRPWVIVALSALLLTVLLATLAEYQYAVPQYALYYYPVIMTFVVPGVLLLGARAAGRRWSATAIALVYLAVQLLAQLELTVVGRTHPTIVFLPFAGLAVDLLWQRWRQSTRPLVTLLAGAGASAALLASEMPFMVLFSPLPWSSLSWAAIAPISLVAGAAGGLLGARIGATVRPEVRAGPANGRLALGVGVPLIGVVALLVLLTGHALAHGLNPAAVVSLTNPSVVVGQPATFEVRISPSDAVTDSRAMKVRLEQAQNHVEPPVEQVGPGIYQATATLPRSGQWVFGLRVPTDGGELVGWFRLQVASPGGIAQNPVQQVLDLHAGPGSGAQAGAERLLVFGKALVWTWTGLLVLGVAYFLRLIELDAHRLAAQAG